MKPIRIEISESVARHRPVPNQKNPGTFFDFYEQSALLFGLVTHGTQIENPVAIVLSVRKDQPYPVGSYMISPESFDVNRFGGIELSRELKLMPYPAQLAKAA